MRCDEIKSILDDDYHQLFDTSSLSSGTQAKAVTIMNTNNDDYSSTKGIGRSRSNDYICTSSVPKLRKRTLFKAVFIVPMNVVLRKQMIFPYMDVQFDYEHDQYPEKVDNLGSIAQIERKY